MMSNTAFNLLAILAVAGSAFAAPLSERSDPNEPLVKVHALPDHSTSGQNGVVMASVGSTNAHVVQTPGNDENILHVQVRPDGTDKPLDAYVNVPSSPLGGKIPQGGVAKSFSHTGDAVAGALQGTDAEDVQDAYKVIDADPLAQAYVGGPYLKAGQKRSSPVQDASGKVILDTEKLVGKPKILNNGGGAAGSLLKTNLKPGALLDTGGAIKSDTGIIRTGLIKTNLVGRDKLRTSASTKATVNPEKAPFKQGNSVGNIKLGDTGLVRTGLVKGKLIERDSLGKILVGSNIGSNGFKQETDHLIDTNGAIKSDTGIIRTGLLRTNLIGRENLGKSPTGKIIIDTDKILHGDGIRVGKGLTHTGSLNHHLAGRDNGGKSIAYLQLAYGSLSKTLTACDSNRHNPDDIVDVCIDSRLLSAAPHGSFACPDENGQFVDSNTAAETTGLYQLCVWSDLD